MIEITLGVLLIAAGTALLAGAATLVPGASGVDVLPLLGYGGFAAIFAFGVVLVLSGLSRRRIRRYPERRAALRTTRLAVAGLLIVATLAIVVPLLAEPANLVTLDGLPVGYYLAAQGALVALVICAFVWAARQAGIEREGGHD